MILKSLKSGSKNRKDHARQLLLLLVMVLYWVFRDKLTHLSGVTIPQFRSQSTTILELGYRYIRFEIVNL